MKNFLKDFYKQDDEKCWSVLRLHFAQYIKNLGDIWST